MQLSAQECELLKQLEEGLWLSKTRFDREWMENILAPDFIEFGQSGRVFGRQQILDIAPIELLSTIPLADLRIKPLDSNTVLLTYISEVQYPEGERRALRSSIWSRDEKSWQLTFHQGTPIANASAI